MKKTVYIFCVMSFMFLCVACTGGDKIVIQERFSQNPKVGVIYTPSGIDKFPDPAPINSSARWLVPVPADFESIAKNEIVNGLKAEWPNASITYEASSTNRLNYDLVIWAGVGGTYHTGGGMTASGGNSGNITLKMRASLTIFDPHSGKNLTSFMGESLGEVSSPSAPANRTSVFTDVIPPVSLKAALEQKTAQGVKDYLKEVRDAKKAKK